MKGRCITVIVILICCLQGHSQSHEIDSIKKLLHTEQEDSNKVNSLNTLSDKLSRIGKADTSMTCAKTAQVLAEKLEYKKGIAIALRNIGVGYLDQSDYSKALEYFFKALPIAKEINIKKEIGTDFLFIGLAYEHEGNCPQSLDYDFKALAVYEETGNKNGIASELVNIGNVYYLQGNYSKVLEYALKSLSMDQELGNKNGIAVNLGNIGNVYHKQGNYPKALEYDFKALALQQELGNKNGMAINLNNIGKIYKDSDECQRSLEYEVKALNIYKEVGNKEGIAEDLGDMGIDYMHLKNYAQAKAYLDTALTLSLNLGVNDVIKDIYSERANLDSATGNYKAGWQDYTNYIIYRDSLMSKANTQKVLEEQMSYDFQRKTDSVNADQEKQKVITEKENQRQKTLLNSFVIGFILMIVLAFFIFRGYRQKQKANVIITRQKEEVEKQKALVEEKNKDIFDSMTYAKRLQEAILPPISLIEQCFTEFFVLYKPKDIVAGDFYWMERTGDTIFIAAADCTGHGVPGALVSVVCSNALNRTVKEFHITEPGKILDKVTELVLETFEKSERNIQDGMDISLCSINTKTNELLWSGAYSSLIYIQNKEMHELSGDKQPVGKNNKLNPFTTHNLKLQKGDTLYLLTDGYADQFGGPRGKKFKHTQLEEKIMEITILRMEKQKQMLEDILEEWKGDIEQVDDILILGIKV
jgi:serine phosphatase RsbU (regulator of sigma subunit)